jgi:hypothetical protein
VGLAFDPLETGFASAGEVYVIAPNVRVKSRVAGTPGNSTRGIGTNPGTNARPRINRLLGGIGAESPKPSGFVIATYDGSRYWRVIDPEGKLVCVTVYKRGAVEVVRRLAA